MKKGEKMSDEQKEKIRLSNLGKKHQISVAGLERMKRKDYEPWNKGTVGIMPTPWNKGTKGKMGLHWNQGKSRLEPKKCLTCDVVFKHHVKKYCTSACYHKSREKEGNHRWIADRSLIKLDSERGGPLHKQWSKDIKLSNGWKCKINNHECDGRLEAHHIYPWKDYPELRYDLTNGIPLCKRHHPRKKRRRGASNSIFP